MKISFYKYHGTGNDFILIDNRKTDLVLTGRQIRSLCERNYGIGADGLMVLSNAKGYDFGMTYYNSDGMESTMCGNGGRCMVAFALKLGIVQANVSFEATDGPHQARVIRVKGADTFVSLKMKDVHQLQKPDGLWILNTGSPHAVKFVENINELDVFTEGQAIRNLPEFGKKGINVDFAQMVDDILYVRTYERGVEDETLSCGTGATAAVLANAFSTGNLDSPRHVLTYGGPLRVHFTKKYKGFIDIKLEGTATFVFTGETDI